MLSGHRGTDNAKAKLVRVEQNSMYFTPRGYNGKDLGKYRLVLCFAPKETLASSVPIPKPKLKGKPEIRVGGC